MPTEFAFRLSTYLTLALSCLCLGYSEWELLTESTVIMVAVLVSLGFSFWANGRYLLDLKAANRVGLLISVIVGGWMTYQFTNVNSLMRSLPMPAGLLPYLGPLLMILMPAKLFRPKHVGDWWAMQGIALAGACLASAMVDDEIFGILLGFYAISGVTSLALFYYRRTANTLPPVPNTDAGPSTEVVSSAGSSAPASGRSIIRKVFGWLVIAMIVSLPLFFLTPRSKSPKWSFGNSRLETGFTGEQNTDLNRSGTLEINREIAIVVHASHDAAKTQPKLDLSPNQRWRGLSFTNYEKGQWTRSNTMDLYVKGASLVAPQPVASSYPLNLGPEQIILDFELKIRLMEPVIADPVAWDIEKPPPVLTLSRSEQSPWKQTPDGSFRPMNLGPNRLSTYRQYTRIPAGADPDLGPPFEVAEAQRPSFIDPQAFYKVSRISRLRDWTVELLARLKRSNPQLKGVLEQSHNSKEIKITERNYEIVARALNDFLKNSGEHEYSLKLRRTDKTLDPIEDFLFNTKAGHCERFASALVLMLRSIGVPAAYVIGFKGCENEGDGRYVIRQEHAHAWAEVLIPRDAPPGFPFATRIDGSPPPKVTWHWLSLDPTPDLGEVETSESLTGWLDSAKEGSVTFFLNFIVGYNADRQGEAVQASRDWVLDNSLWLLTIPAIFLMLVMLRGIVRRARNRPRSYLLGDVATGIEWFDQYLAVLKRFKFQPAIGATPAEYAVAVSEVLRTLPSCSAQTETPLLVTQAFYLQRYAKQQPTEAERARLDEAVERLAEALKSCGSARKGE